MSDDTFIAELFDGDYWLTPDELADWLKLRKDWVYDTVQAEKIPFHKFGRQLRFRHSEIQAWLIGRQPANSLVVLTITWPDGTTGSTSIDVRDLLGELMVPTEPVEEETVVVQAEVDEAGMEIAT